MPDPFNLRSTVTNMAPNLVRGATYLITNAFVLLIPGVGASNAALIVGAVCVGLSFLGVLGVKETFHEDMDFMEC